MATRLIVAYTLLALMVAFIAVTATVLIRRRRAANIAKWSRGRPI